MTGISHERLLLLGLCLLLAVGAACMISGPPMLEVRCDALWFDVCLRPPG